MIKVKSITLTISTAKQLNYLSNFIAFRIHITSHDHHENLNACHLLGTRSLELGSRSIIYVPCNRVLHEQQMEGHDLLVEYIYIFSQGKKIKRNSVAVM